MKEVFIIGSKGIPANYGGFETFVDRLTENRKSDSINYHVSCLSDEESEFVHNKARCFNVKVPNIGAAKAVYYDLKALYMCLRYIEKNDLKNTIIYILACRIGPFMWLFKNKIKQLQVEIYVNPDGHEWKRGKWIAPIKWYWKQSEKYMVKNSDLLVCDSINIEKYIQTEYEKFSPKTTYISYGADTTLSILEDESPLLREWYDKYDITKENYYLIVGRFVPENNYELMIREFMKSDTTKDLVIITNVEQNKFYNQLESVTDFKKDSRIKFVGTLYNQELLKKVRENAFGYLHGHEVGVDGVVIRHPQNNYFEELIPHLNIPIFNGGDGSGNHPTQSLLDLLTIYQEYGKFEGLKIAIVGDIAHSRVAHTNIEVMNRLGMEVHLVAPDQFQEEGYQWENLDDVLEEMDIIMLLRVQHERHDGGMQLTKEEYHAQYGLTLEREKRMKEGAIIMHPAPFNRGVEIADDVVECKRSRIFKQMSNGVFVRMSVLVHALG